MVDEIDTGSVLIVGDGNFSFTVAFCRRLNRLCPERVPGMDLSIIGSVRETEMELVQRYEEAAVNIKELKEKGITTLYRVDATRLSDLKDDSGQQLLFDHLIFNFPHVGGKTNLRKSRRLLLDVFLAVHKFLLVIRSTCFLFALPIRLYSVVSGLKKQGRFYLTLARGQSGLSQLSNADTGEFLPSPPSHSLDSWQPLHLASYAGLVAEARKPFLASEWPSYECAGYKNTSRQFHVEGAETLVFRRAVDIASVDRLHSLPVESNFDAFHSLRPHFTHDISFWITDAFQVDAFVQLVRRLSKGLVKRVEKLAQYCCCEDTVVNGKATRRSSLCFRFIWQSVDCALTREAARDLQLVMREQLPNALYDDCGYRIYLR